MLTSLPEEANMMNNTPIFPMTTEADHYSDYGFDVNYFQALEEARRHPKRKESRPLDSLHCKLKKPISKDESKGKKRRQGWWKSALLFWRRPKVGDSSEEHHAHRRPHHGNWPAASGPIYATESGGCGVGRRARRPSAGLLMAAAEIGAEAASGLAYLSLRDHSLSDGLRVERAVPSPMPIYLVT
ncbi:hypothetical protein Cni_G24787 [Canna indica]|uniref:Uncharacterized protein n=1 Tax=Canna indica TaxID=4628 RepID=A0AAQ3QPW6_9LILI|nr:hypothetical protein Cni_G24787 [Canna indica]